MFIIKDSTGIPLDSLANDLLERLYHGESPDSIVSRVENGNVLDVVERFLDDVSENAEGLLALEAEDTLSDLRAARARYGEV